MLRSLYRGITLTYLVAITTHLRRVLKDYESSITKTDRAKEKSMARHLIEPVRYCNNAILIFVMQTTGAVIEAKPIS